MPAPRQETLTRPTDIVADQPLSRLGNDGVQLFDDLLSRVNQSLGIPIEVVPASPSSTQLIVGAAQYLLPDGQRQTVYSDGAIASLVSGVIDFAAGTINGGSVSGFSLPLMTAGNYIKALIQYEVDSDSLNVTFGVENASLALVTVPSALVGYTAICLVELHSTAGGMGVFDAIIKSNLIKLLDFSPGGGEVSGPREEVQAVVGSPQSVFNLLTIQIPANRLKLKVETNGVDEEYGVDYTVTSDAQVTFVVPRIVNARIKFRVG